jgi:hypothetical protein
VVIIGQGEPERAGAYARRYELPDCAILCDPDYEAYQAYGLPEFAVEQVLFDAPESMWRPDAENGRWFQEKRREMGRPLVDNPWQAPGEFVVDRTGLVRIVHRYNHCEDFPDPRVFTTAARLLSS